MWSLVLGIAAFAAPEGARAGVEQFEARVRPVLAERCHGCHSGAANKTKGGLALDSVAGIRRGGGSGPLVVPGDVRGSLLLKAVRHEESLDMPPEGPRLSPAAVAALEEWVRMGAPLPEEAAPPPAPARPWSLEPLRARDARLGPEAIDRLVRARLAAAGMAPAPRADPHTLLRRVHYDLVGLPPSAAEQGAFARDPSPRAFATVVDRLLASPRFGEHWGRRWLDVARYADTRGLLGRFPYSYTYRDWVIRAFNEDLPHDRFVTLQLAADMPGAGARPGDLAALGFITLGRQNLLDTEQDIIDDRIDVLTRGLLGLTVSCARCHDHKFDPVSMQDYYALYGVFASTRQPESLPRLDPEAPADAREQRYEEGLRQRREAIEAFVRRRHAEHEAELRAPAVVARYLVGVHATRSFGVPAIEAYAIEKDLNLFVLQRWRAALAAARPDDAVWGPWLASRDVEAASARQAALLARFDGDVPRPNAREEALRLALRGPAAPTRVPLEDAEQLQSEGDKNNLRALRRKLDAWGADGETLHGRQTLIARRLIERGVRFVQLWHGGGQPWDNHTDLEDQHRKLAGECDQPIAALLEDLAQRGLLEETLVIWGGEFGRTPSVEIGDAKTPPKRAGRDHNPYGFTMWLAGGGVRGGYVHGATDELGFRAVDKPMHVHDLHATILHLLGFDHERFVFRYAGRDFRLTDVHGRVIRELVA